MGRRLDARELIENTVHEDFVARKPPNLYVAGAVDNPYAHIGQMDLFFLSSREDPIRWFSPRPWSCACCCSAFSRTTAVAGPPRAQRDPVPRPAQREDAARVIKACAPNIALGSLRVLADSWISTFDLKEKMRAIVELIEKVRAAEEETPPGMNENEEVAL